MSLLDLIANTVVFVIKEFGYPAVFIAMFLESACIPIPSEVVMPFSGFASSQGVLSFWPVVAIGVLGQTCGSTITYFIGKSGGRRLLEKYGKYVLIATKDIKKADGWFDRYGEATVLFTRMMPVVRTFISLPAGISRMGFSKFLAYSVIGIIPWTLMLTYVGVKMGQNWERIRNVFHGFDYAIVAVFAVLVAVYVWNHIKHAQEAPQEQE
ncbi:MAG TPA: DedA family protein [Candidatus Aquicultor sp.]|jgi:membrane protein DedA with SNARE-associated domain